MAYLETLRPFKGNGRSRHFLVRTGSNDPFDFAQYQQVQLARWTQKSWSSVGAKCTHAISRASNQVLRPAGFQMEGLGFKNQVSICL